MAPGLVKAMMLLLSINLLLYVAGVRVIGTDNVDFINEFVNETALREERIEVQGGYKDTLPTTLEESGSSLLDFIDSLSAIKTFVIFLINIIFTPVGLLISAGLPQTITLLIGMPIMFAGIVGMAYFIRSGS